jgi:hypothetical protein
MKVVPGSAPNGAKPLAGEGDVTVKVGVCFVNISLSEAAPVVTVTVCGALADPADTTKLEAKRVPSTASLQTGPLSKLGTSVFVIVQPPALLKPEPVMATVVPVTPRLGVMTKRGVTWKAPALVDAGSPEDPVIVIW